MLALAAAAPPAPPAGDAAKPPTSPATDPRIVPLLKSGEVCPDEAPESFYEPRQATGAWNVEDWGQLSIYAANWCTVHDSPFFSQCIVYGPGGASLKSEGKDKAIYYVPPKHVALMTITSIEQKCWMVSLSKSRAGKAVDRLLAAETRKGDKRMFQVGIEDISWDDYVSAASYLSTSNGNPDAGYLSATMFDRGLGRDVDHVKAAYMLYSSASRGYYPAQLRLGEMYRDGVGVQADPHAAAYWLKQARWNPKKKYSAYDRMLDAASPPNPDRP
ncbi:tetratricopeptide repeat protein [Caulobacter sp. S45]|uniref:tetratricopeptide repeat protein n=1 Tax=Caulobacter sp. S45 TaxID=1641861 RepID=UPI00131E9787|nr:SEL1-like repeat protein [Caulobacter sp. S45]